MTIEEVNQEVARLCERIADLRMLQQGQRHLPFIAKHLEEHIAALQQRMEELRQQLPL